jgi:hypothetical protein
VVAAERDRDDHEAERAVDESAGGEGTAAADAVNDVAAADAAGIAPVGEEGSVEERQETAGMDREEGVAQPGG